MKLRILLLTFLAALLFIPFLNAATQYWDAGVNSNWDTTTLNWSGLAWLNGNDAVFGVSANLDDNHPFLSRMFSDNMVLQRGTSDPVRGWTDPGAAVTVSIAGTAIQATGTAGTDGKWMVYLPAPPVGGPYTINIDGPQSVTLSNVLVGDVWLCSGQSNMQYTLNWGVDNAAAEIAAANYPNIRLVLPQARLGMIPGTKIAGQWQVCSPATVGDFSAVAYFYGRKLNQDLNIPIGLIDVSVGGTLIESWSSPQALLQVEPALQSQLDTIASAGAGVDIYAAWYAANDPGSIYNNSWDSWASPTFDDSAWGLARLPNLPSWSDLWNLYTSGYTGTIWFRNTFTLPAVKGDMTLIFSSDDVATVWVNGQKVGAVFDRTLTRCTLPSGLLKAGTNSLVFRFLHADTSVFSGVTCTADQFTLVSAAGVTQSLAGQWKYSLGVSLAVTPVLPLVITRNTLSMIYNGMIAPLAPFGIKGTIWYQGETNNNAAGYRQQLPPMIADWRALWGEGDFPFYIVQLPYYGTLQSNPADSGGELRDSQSVAAQNTSNSGLAVTLELGDAVNVHPSHKQEVGRRLALLAEAKTYGMNLVYSGPVYSSMAVSGSTIVLHFATGGSPLAAALTDSNSQPVLDFTKTDSPVTVTANTALAGFVIAGADKQWQWATAKIAGDTVVVSSPLVPNPVAVRYAWGGNPPNNLLNQAGLPASCFRTDNWPLTTPLY